MALGCGRPWCPQAGARPMSAVRPSVLRGGSWNNESTGRLPPPAHEPPDLREFPGREFVLPAGEPAQVGDEPHEEADPVEAGVGLVQGVKALRPAAAVRQSA